MAAELAAVAAVMERFGAATRAWFQAAFAQPTIAQLEAWQAISGGANALVVAPTGSGKTLAAFLWAIDRLHHEPVPLERSRRCRVLYVSPLKALATDVQRNLRAPLVGISQAEARLGLATPDIHIGVRTGDTPANERRTFATKPPDILVTTPESLFLILTSAARAGLAGVETVIIDEIHALAGTKRGAHLALALERLDAYLETNGGEPAQRIGLSATVAPVREVAKFLSGNRPVNEGGRECKIVQPESQKQWQIDIVTPVPDMVDLTTAPVSAKTYAEPQVRDNDNGGPGAVGSLVTGTPEPYFAPDFTGEATSAIRKHSVWPYVQESIADRIENQNSTLVFTNSRRGAERLTTRLNEIHAERMGFGTPDPGSSWAGPMPGASEVAAALPTDAPLLARAHHGSMSRMERLRTESELKAGNLPAVVATSSLELGIDMGAIDLVIQVGSPPSVASGLQRVGRAGHQVGAVSHGLMYPTHRGDLVPMTVVAKRMRAGLVEKIQVLNSPLDVLAQHIVSAVAMDDWPQAELLNIFRRAYPYKNLSEANWLAVLDMLSGRYPAEEFAELRARITWDRNASILAARPGAQRLAASSGGTIPDRGLYGVFLVGSTDEQRGGKRVGELDEEMVHESRVGDTITLGSSTWRIEEITPNQVLVSPAPGLPGRLPFWRGDAPARPVELGQAIGRFVREIDLELATDSARGLAHLRSLGLDEWAADNLAAHLTSQRFATGTVPSDRTVIVEQFRDELGDWRVVIHCPLGSRITAPWALLIANHLTQRLGVMVSALHNDNGIVLRLPSLGWDDNSFEAATDSLVDAEDLLVDPENVSALVTDQLGNSILFAARFREAAGRALLLPRQSPNKRQPLWQQRQRAAHLLDIASQYPSFPIMLEAAREVLQDDFDIAAFSDFQKQLANGHIRLINVTTPTPSPFAQDMLFGYAAEFLYNGDAPLAERRLAALSLNQDLLADLLGNTESVTYAELLDAEVVAQLEAELQWLAEKRQAKSAEQVWDMLRALGPLSEPEIARRIQFATFDAALPFDFALPPNGDPQNDGEGAPTQARDWLAELAAQRRIIQIRLAGDEVWAAVEDAARLRDAFGVALPVGLPEVFLEPLPDPLGDLISRHVRTHGPVTAEHIAKRFGIGTAIIRDKLEFLTRKGALTFGALRPIELGGIGEEWANTEVLRRLRRRSLAALRKEAEPVESATLGVFLPHWQQVGPAAAGRGRDGLLRAIEQLAGYPVPASALESLILPARVVDYQPELLDEVTASGEVIWVGHGRLPGSGGGDGMVSLHLAADAPWTVRPNPTAEVIETESSADVVGDSALPSAMGRRMTDERASPNEDSREIKRPLATRVLELLRDSGGYFLPRLAELANSSISATLEVLWELVWAGLVTNDRLTPLREAVGTGAGGAHRAKAQPTRGRALRPGRFSALSLGSAYSASSRNGDGVTPKAGGGRWAAVPQPDEDPNRRALALTQVLLDRHGVLTRAVANSENASGEFSNIYQVLRQLEDRGRVRRGYFVEGLGGAQFALPGGVDLLRNDSTDRQLSGAVLLAATDPANPYGAALPWPESDGEVKHRPGRKAGAVVVLVAGELVLYLERGGKTLLTFGSPTAEADESALRDPAILRRRPQEDGYEVGSREYLANAVAKLAETARAGNLGKLTISKINGDPALLAAKDRTPEVVALLEAGFVITPSGLKVGNAKTDAKPEYRKYQAVSNPR